MFTVALIGADGAGKSTIARMLQNAFPTTMKYLYMGINPGSSNFALPTSRIVLWLKIKIWRYKHRSRQPDSSTRTTPKNKPKRAKNIRAAVRIILFLSEEYFRQCISWIYQIRGYIVIFDRHFAFDYDTRSINPENRPKTVAEGLHRWLLTHFYPRPHLIIFLDAPPEVLFARKGEGTLDYLEDRRKSFLEQGKLTPNFITIDATEPVEKVIDQVSEHVLRFYESRTGKSLSNGLKN